MSQYRSVDSMSASYPTRHISNNSSIFANKQLVKKFKSVSFSEPDFDANRIPESPSADHRSSGSGRDSSSIDRTSQVIEAIFETVQDVTCTWNRFLGKWGPTILLIFLSIPSLYIYRMVAGDIMFTIGKLRNTAIHQFDEAVAEFHNRQNHHTINTNMKLNLSAQMQQFWGEYADMLKTTAYEQWFVNARDADDAITAMYNGLPPAAGNETQRRTRIKGLVDLRSTQRKRAEVFFENFLAGRLVTADTILNEAREFRTWLQWKLLNGEKPAKTVLAKFTLAPSASDKQNMTSYVLNHAATVFVKRLIIAHEALYVTRDLSSVQYGLSPVVEWMPVWERRFDVLRAIEWAEETESHCIRYLRQNSTNAQIWKDHHSSALRFLKRKLLGLQRRLNKMEAKMNRLVARFEFENNRTAEDILADTQDLLVWIEDVEGLLSNLEAAYTPLAEAHIWAQRRHDVLRADIESFDYEKNWQKWKENNCGFASCYEAAPNGVMGRFATQVHKHLGFRGKPLAKTPLGLSESREDALWEKTCCGESKHNEWLDLLKYGKGITYQYPHRVEQQAAGAVGEGGD